MPGQPSERHTAASRQWLRRVSMLTMLVVGSSTVAFVGLEACARILEGYPLLALQLPPGFAPAAIHFPPPPAVLAGVASGLHLEPDTDPAWIDEPPPPLSNRRPVDAELLEIRSRANLWNLDEFNLYNIWNRNVAENRGCSTLPELSRLPMPLRVFDPIEANSVPPYRYYPGRTTPLGMTTNAFGFRGPEIPLNKPAGTVRIAFVGASTTVGFYGFPFSYPEYVVHWLNRWAEMTKMRVRFDLVNAGRTGMPSDAIAAIVRQEVLPLEPDLILYYEGSNQFVFADNLVGKPMVGRPKSPWEQVVLRASPFSALVGRVARGVRSFQGEIPEPQKPSYNLHWPDGVHIEDPDIRRTDLPLELSKILADLRSLSAAATSTGADFAMSSFVFFVHDGLRLSPSQQFTYDWLNDRCWPYTYADLRRFADFQNLVFERFARADDLLFVDLARQYPLESKWFFDAIHFSDDGTRLQAWIVFQSLLPRIRDRIASGAWPRSDRDPAIAHPNFHGYHDLVLPCAH